MKDIKLLYIDLFCGAGGTSTGVGNARHNGEQCAKVIACVNHDANAIASHAANHPDALHFTEDIRTLDLTRLIAHVEAMRQLHPAACIVLWASLECTNFSIAKGGQSRDADSRTLAEHLFRYVEQLNPHYIQIENVKEFMTWGPLIVKVVKDKKTGAEYCPLEIKTIGSGKNKKKAISPVWIPEPERKGEYYRRWINDVKGYNYNFQHRILDAADYGAFTSRKRFFGIFAKSDFPIVFPEPTHTRKPTNNLFSVLKKWRPVREVLDLQDEGDSIFSRKKPLVEATHERIYAGLIKFVAGGMDAFMIKYNSVNGKTGRHIPPSIDEPCPVVAAQARLGVAKVCFLSRYNSVKPIQTAISLDGPCGSITTENRFASVSARFLSKHFSGHPNSKNLSIDGPAHAVTGKDHHSIVSADFLSAYYGNGHNHSTNAPAPTVTTKDRLAYIKPCFMDMAYGNGTPSDVNTPAGTVTTNPKHQLVTCTPWIMSTNFNNVGSSINDPSQTITANRKWHYLMNPQYTSKGGSIDMPCFTLIARMDKMPPYLMSAENETEHLPSFIKIANNVLIYEIYDTDSPVIVQIKEFMALYGITDIKMRMLKILELKRIMGFPANYLLIGTQEEQKKYIGNAVEVTMAKVLCEALAFALKQYNKPKTTNYETATKTQRDRDSNSVQS